MPHSCSPIRELWLREEAIGGCFGDKIGEGHKEVGYSDCRLAFSNLTSLIEEANKGTAVYRLHTLEKGNFLPTGANIICSLSMEPPRMT